MFRLLILIGVVLMCALGACKKDSFITSPDANVSFSADTIHFDTVFTSVGSTTRLLKIFNNNNQKLKIDRLSLTGGINSFFKINIDGSASPNATNIELEANDSMYIFATVLVDPTSGDLPFVIEDSIEIIYNGNRRVVPLQAWGQNANFLRAHKINSNETWNNERPYVIIGELNIANNVTLTIPKGTRVYVHADAPIMVDGTLKVQGGAPEDERVSIQSDRLDEPYKDFPASWPGIYFREGSRDNVIDYAIIRNAYQGIVVNGPSLNASPKLSLNQTIIDNCYDAGILAIGSSISASNTLISNCGKGILLAYGGDYQFEHCTGVAVSNNYILHKDPVLFASNFLRVGTNVQVNALTARFTNCIFWGTNGTVDNEVVTARQGSAAFNVVFENCLWKVKESPADVTARAIITEDPEFEEIDPQKRKFNFRLKSTSPAIDRGKSSSLTVDLDGRNRSVRQPDLGTYEMD